MTLGDTRAFALRPLQSSDAARITALISEFEVARWLSSPPYPYVLADADAYLATAVAQHRDRTSRTAALVVDGDLAGLIDIEPNSLGLNFGYWLGRPYWGRGLMTRAATEMAREHFAGPDAAPLNSGYFFGNAASAAIQRRLGFEAVGEGQLFNRPEGKRLPHVTTRLTRSRFVSRNREPASS